MSIVKADRAYFCSSAFPGEKPIGGKNWGDVRKYLDGALNEPWRANEFEAAAEGVLRNNGFDPNHDLGWKNAGIEDGRVGAVRLIRQAYLSAVPDHIKHIENMTGADASEFTPSAVDEYNPLDNLVASFKRAHFGKDMDFLCSDEAWQEAGVGGVAEFQKAICDIFVNAKIGNWVSYKLDPKSSDTSRCDQLSQEAADYAIQNAFPELAAKLGIQVDIKQGLMAQPSKMSSSFLGAQDVTFPCVPK